jgi:GT2 family glycosyltransferase
MITYNRFDTLDVGVQSVLDQTRAPDRVIVVDSASPDSTAARLRARYPELEVLELMDNLGPGAALAMGMRHAMTLGAEYLWLLEDDNRYEPDFLEIALEVMEQQPTVQLLGAAGWDFDGRLWRSHTTKDGEIDVAVGALPMLDATLVRREAVDAVGVPAEDYFIMIIDVEYPLRMAEAGFSTAVASRLRYTALRVGATSGRGGPPFRAYYQTRNHLRMAVQRRSLALLLGFVRRTIALCTVDIRSGDQVGRRLALRAVAVVDAIRGRMGRTVEPFDVRPWPRRP